MKLLVDGFFFQINNTGIARVWRSILPHLAAREDFHVYMLDRGHAPMIESVTYIPFPTNSFSQCADDSILIQRVCDQFGIDVFTSTYYTTPLSTPMLLMVHDMIPELFQFDLNQRAWMEKDTAICFAQRYLCISENTRNDLLLFYPEIPPTKAIVEYCGVVESIFRIRSADDVAKFRQEHGLHRPYFLFVGSRVQHNGYKNSRLFFDAVGLTQSPAFDVLCVGGEKEIEQEALAKVAASVRCIRVELTDEQLSLAYNGAIALIYPSLYEGFGMPVIEAMACGCPVITTPHGSLAEVAGDAACLVSGTSVEEMLIALRRMNDSSFREALRLKGLRHAKRFRWAHMTDRLALEFAELHEDAQGGMFDAFFGKWRSLRQMQANVDF
jgi:glycosyltransferase involved in cell wall biosynthesis